MPEQAHWQVQEAKQRFSEVIRAVETSGPQTITRHGEEVAVVIDIEEYRRLVSERHDFADHLMSFPKLAGQAGATDDVFDEVQAERKADFGRPVELGMSQ